ncbi:MAG: nicotinate (nicotinamide) nucleotide adenylyltransferase [Phycisphaeraceae bacterium JB051]
MGDELTPKPGDTVLLFGGSFDPPHAAHIRLPQQAKAAINADHLAFIPAAQQPLKQSQTPAHHRLAMLKLALKGSVDCHVLELELKRQGPSYTVDTVRELKAKWGDNVTLRFLIGADQLAAFNRWRDWQTIEQLAQPVIMHRDGQMPITVPDGFDRDKWLKRVIQVDRIDISSTNLRNHLAVGQHVDETLLAKSVQDYIHAHQLYR